jgi:Zn-dependent oligopeptidase
MNPNESAVMQSEREALVGQLRTAETTLRGRLYQDQIDPVARAHMERALAHVREACAAIRDTGSARTVDQLVSELQHAQQLLRARCLNCHHRTHGKSTRH